MITVLERHPNSLNAQIRESRTDITASHPNDDWVFYGESIGEYESAFRGAYDRLSLPNFVRSRPSPVVIDLMSPSEMLANLFRRIPNKDKFGIAVSLGDRRSATQKERDNSLGIHQIAGDIMSSSTWKLVDKILGAKKADLVLERAEAGLNYIPVHEKLFAMMVQRAWHVLNENGGVFLAQAPVRKTLDRYNFRMEEWISLLKKNGIDAVYKQIDPFEGFLSAYVKLIKAPNSPKDLPFLV